MSEQLYRTDHDVYTCPTCDHYQEWDRVDGLVPVEPCEHGNYAEHWFEDSSDGANGHHPVYVWCEGAGLGGSDEEVRWWWCARYQMWRVDSCDHAGYGCGYAPTPPERGAGDPDE